jgi:hypothetical protein
MDVIDIGHRIFDRLVDSYGEDPKSRLLFLAGCTTGFEWFVINSDKQLKVTDHGIFANFEDEVITQINAEIKEEIRKRDEEVAKKFAQEMEKGRDKFKDGDTYHFWSDTSNNINIDIKF